MSAARRGARAGAGALCALVLAAAGCGRPAGEASGPASGAAPAAATPSAPAEPDGGRASGPQVAAAATQDVADADAMSPADVAPAHDPLDDPITAQRLGALLRALPPDRAPGRPGHEQARAWLVEQLEGFGLAPRVQPVAWSGEPQAAWANVEVVWPGVSDVPRLLVLGAHFDSVAGTPGADDNGSGVVALLELARRLRRAEPEHELRLVFFDGEEVALIGSGAWVAALGEVDRRRLVGFVGLETIGYADRRPRSQRLPPGVSTIFDPGDRGDFLLVVGNVASTPLAAAVGDALDRMTSETFRVEVFSGIPGDGWLIPDVRRSDHARFWDAGLPAVMLTDTANFRNPHYHRASDTPETLDLEFLEAAVRGLELFVRLAIGA